MALPENLPEIVEATLQFSKHRINLDKKMLKLWTSRQALLKSKEIIIIAKQLDNDCNVTKINIRSTLDYYNFSIYSSTESHRLDVELFASVKGVRYKIAYYHSENGCYGYSFVNNIQTFSLEEAKQFINNNLIATAKV